ncbi:MAG: hypothetical protein EAY65_00465 [Alphaproteobacteria bacterium]|nr:MAG: hypothetical protein EAY65_00465 [Alphaproteobacteria bacterium]
MAQHAQALAHPLRPLKAAFLRAVDMLYGTPERTQKTLYIVFAMLIIGILMMEFASSTSSCAL